MGPKAVTLGKTLGRKRERRQVLAGPISSEVAIETTTGASFMTGHTDQLAFRQLLLEASPAIHRGSTGDLELLGVLRQVVPLHLIGGVGHPATISTRGIESKGSKPVSHGLLLLLPLLPPLVFIRLVASGVYFLATEPAPGELWDITRMGSATRAQPRFRLQRGNLDTPVKGPCRYGEVSIWDPTLRDPPRRVRLAGDDGSKLFNRGALIRKILGLCLPGLHDHLHDLTRERWQSELIISLPHRLVGNSE